MRKLDLYWMSIPDWWDIKNLIPVIRDDAPEEAQASYDRCCIQKGLDCYGRVLEMQDALLRKENGTNTEDVLFLYWYLWELLQKMYEVGDEVKAVRIYRTVRKNDRIAFLIRKYNI